MILSPAFGSFHQLAWVTNDLERGMEVFRETYQVPKFAVIENSFPGVAHGVSGTMKIRIALANVDQVQLELIEPVGDGITSIYRDVLPPDGSFANVFHHVCVKINGTLDDWNAYVEELGPSRPVCLTGDIGDGVRFLYTDERPKIGIYFEHVWFGPEMDRMMREMVPTYHSR